jgi:hypothetical protein
MGEELEYGMGTYTSNICGIILMSNLLPMLVFLIKNNEVYWTKTTEVIFL